MVQTTYNEQPASRRYAPSTSPKNFIIVYEQPKVSVVRRYTKTVIPQVNPVDYEKKFGRALLDTSTLLALTRRLNIPENLITPPKIR